MVEVLAGVPAAWCWTRPPRRLRPAATSRRRCRYPSARTVPLAAYELQGLVVAPLVVSRARAAYEIALRGGQGALAAGGAAAARTWEWPSAPTARSASMGPRRAPGPAQLARGRADRPRAHRFGRRGARDAAVAAYQLVLKEMPAGRRADDVRGRLASLGTATANIIVFLKFRQKDCVNLRASRSTSRGSKPGQVDRRHPTEPCRVQPNRSRSVPRAGVMAVIVTAISISQ